MLQILLAFLAISIISTAGYGLVEQLSLQQMMSDQRENVRRLDVAADAIQARLVSMPGVDGVFAPAPQNLAGNGWSYMPAGLGGINASVQGVPFVYCPIAPTAGDYNDTVRSGGGSYGIQTKSGVVVASELGNATPLKGGLAAYRPVAFIIASTSGENDPPSCAAVQERNGRPFVSGGLVKVVSRPTNTPTPGVGTIAASTSDLYVGPGAAGGSGRVGDPTTLDDALRHYALFRPAEMTIHLLGNVSASGDAWTAFANAMGASSGRLTLDGAGFTLSAPAGQVNAAATTTLSNLSLAGPTLIVSDGDVVNTRGNLGLAPGAGGPAVIVQNGGRLNVANGTVSVGGSAENGVESSGDVVLNTGAIVAGGRQWSLALTGGGRLWANGVSRIGDVNARNVVATLLVNGATAVIGDASSTVAATSSGVCWSATPGSADETFAYSENGAGRRSSVTPDGAAPPAPVPGSDTYSTDVATYNSWRRDVDGRQRARQTNHSNFLCQ